MESLKAGRQPLTCLNLSFVEAKERFGESVESLKAGRQPLTCLASCPAESLIVAGRTSIIFLLLKNLLDLLYVYKKK